jgi:hypothetical protein
LPELVNAASSPDPVGDDEAGEMSPDPPHAASVVAAPSATSARSREVVCMSSSLSESTSRGSASCRRGLELGQAAGPSAALGSKREAKGERGEARRRKHSRAGTCHRRRGGALSLRLDRMVEPPVETVEEGGPGGADLPGNKEGASPCGEAPVSSCVFGLSRAADRGGQGGIVLARMWNQDVVSGCVQMMQ